MNKKIWVIAIVLIVTTIAITSAILLSRNSQNFPIKSANLNESGVCNVDSDCKRIEGYDANGCPNCSSYAGNLFDEKNFTFGKPSNSSKCPMLDCVDPLFATHHPACENNKCVMAKNTKVSDCKDNINCFFIFAKENNDPGVCEKVKELWPSSPGSYATCLFQFAQSVENCSELSRKLNISPDSDQATHCFLNHAKINDDCSFIQQAYEKNKCLANTATKIKECEFIDTKTTEKNPTDYRLWCYRRTENAIPESIDDCNLLMYEDDFPINCINNFVKQNLSKAMLINSCNKLKNKKSIDYCLSQVN